MKQIYARLDCVENLTRQRHDRDQTENQQNAATVDSCFELVGSRQNAVAQQKAISYPESSGFLVSGATPGRLWGHRILLPQDFLR